MQFYSCSSRGLCKKVPLSTWLPSPCSCTGWGQAYVPSKPWLPSPIPTKVNQAAGLNALIQENIRSGGPYSQATMCLGLLYTPGCPHLVHACLYIFPEGVTRPRQQHCIDVIARVDQREVVHVHKHLQLSSKRNCQTQGKHIWETQCPFSRKARSQSKMGNHTWTKV